MLRSVILTYHSLDESGSHMSVRPSDFERQIEWISRSGRVFSDVSSLVNGTAPPGAVAVTFDDGISSVMDVALPLLASRGAPATVFPISSRLAMRIRWRDERGELPAFLTVSAQDLHTLATSGWEIGSHTVDHACLVDATHAQLIRTLTQSRRELEQMSGMRVRGVAYPNGCNSAYVRDAVQDAGFDWAVGTAPGTLGAKFDRFDIHRVNIGATTSPMRFRAAFMPLVQAARRMPLSPRSQSDGHTHPLSNETTEFTPCT